MKRYSAEEKIAAMELRKLGLGARRVASRLGIPVETVSYWLKKYAGVAQVAEAIGSEPIQCGFESHHQHTAIGFLSSDRYADYAYILGLYLGNGSISTGPRTHRIRIVLSTRYPDVINMASSALSAVFPHNKVSVIRRPSKCLDVACYSNALQILFPQCGPGKKHDRRIELLSWQEQVLRGSEWPFIRGLMHSDGCRFINVYHEPSGDYRYPCYSFCNRSGDIIGLLRTYCTIVGVEHTWGSETRDNGVTYYARFYRRDAVERLDAAGCAKS